MRKSTLLLPLVALAALAGCATEHKVAPAPAPVVVAPPQPAPAGTVVVPQAANGSTVVVAAAPAPLRAGTGHIESILDIPRSAAAGSSVPDANKRVGIRMDDGTLQYVDTAATDLSIGERVSITSDGYMKHPAP
jgi:hypothetical protein